MEHFLEFKKQTTEKLNKYEKLNELEQQTGVEKFFIAIGGFILTGILLFVLGGGQLVSNVVGFLYPAYMSFKALNTPQPDDDTQWLTYWVVFCFFNLTEQITSIFMSWIPFYFIIKIIFLIWLYYPQTKGATKLYFSGIKPLLSNYASCIDSAFSATKSK